MSDVFSPKRLWAIVWILGAIVVIKVLWVVAEWLTPLPVRSIEHDSNTVKHALHYRYRLSSDDQLKAPDKPKEPTKSLPTKASLDTYKLVGIYKKGNYSLVTLMRGTKSFVLSNKPKGGEVEGYHLEDTNVTAAFFINGNEKTTLKLLDKKSTSAQTDGPTKKAIATPEKKTSPEKKPKSDNKIIDTGDTKVIDRSLIQEYTENPDKIWKNIGLHEVKKDGKLGGFKVRFVRRGSPFEKLGLKRGDVIKSINGEPIVDYATPMRMLKSAETIDDLSLTVERNHEEQELKYEVK
jgi:general secretion pathway protein C